MKVMKKGVKRSVVRLLEKTFNLFVVLSLLLQPVGTVGLYGAFSFTPNIARAETVDQVDDQEQEENNDEEAEESEESEEGAGENEEGSEEGDDAGTEEDEEGTGSEEGDEEGTESENPDSPLLPVPPVAEIPPIVSELPGTEEDVNPTVPSDLPPVDETAKEVWEDEKDEKKATTKENVVLDISYEAPFNKDVKLIFSKLPEKSGTLSIEEIVLSEEETKALGALSNVAYDITSTMEDGTFEYTLTLPTPKNTEAVEILYAEDVASLDEAEAVSGDDLKIDEDSVSTTLDHFTVFVVVSPAPTGPACISEGATTGMGCYALIQEAINASVDGDTVLVKPGTYVEQLVIDGKDITLAKTGVGTVTVQAPTTIVSQAGTFTDTPIIFVTNGDVVIKDITVDGAGLGNDLTYFEGIAYYNATGTIDGVTVKNMRNTPPDGVQGGEGILLQNADAEARTVTIKNSRVETFQKNGITAYGNDKLKVILDNNKIICEGALDYIAQNGIQYSDGATGTIMNTTVTGCSYDNPDDELYNREAAAILLYENGKDMVIKNNTISASDNAIYPVYSDTGLKISGNTLTNNFRGVRVYDDRGGDDRDGSNPIVFDANAFSSNSIDIDNYASSDIDALSTTSFSVVDPGNLNQIEARLSHDCALSPYLHGFCNGDDYEDGEMSFGSIKYAAMGSILATVVNVEPSNLHGWIASDDGLPTGTSSFATTPSGAPIGTGSLGLTVDSTGRSLLYAPEFQAVPFSRISAMSYHAYTPIASVDNAVTLQFNYDNDLSDGTNSYQGRLVFEPLYSNTIIINDTWQALNPKSGKWWATPNAFSTLDEACPQAAPCTWSEVLSASPNAGVGTAAGFGGILVKLGGPITGGATSYVDKLRLVTDTIDKTFNFDPDTPRPVCGNGIQETGEACDYGDQNGQSTCSRTCQWEAPVCSVESASVTNGEFEIPSVTNEASWGIFDNNEVPGWTAEWYGGRDDGNRPTPKIELHNGVNGWTTSSDQYVELDSDWDGPSGALNGDPASIKLSQTIPTIIGNEYTLSFDYAPRPNHADNRLQVEVTGLPSFDTGTLPGGGNVVWTTKTMTFVATSALTTVSFTEMGTPDSFGMFLDNVRLSCEAPLLTSTVQICKVEAGTQNALPGWTLYLEGESVQKNLSVPSTSSAGVNSNALIGGVSYLAKGSGTWQNQGGANLVDPEYSTTDDWVTHMDGYTGFQNDILELQINSTFDPNSNWGAYNSAHTYAQSFVPGVDGPANFRIFDGTGTTQNESWFGDNSGSLSVDLSRGYAGITGQNGCVVFQDVPYGTYTVGEIEQDGFDYVSGADSVVIDSGKESFTVVNAREVRTGTLEVKKIIVGNEEASPSEFSFELDDILDVQFEADGSNEFTLPLGGSYTVTEMDAPGYTTTYENCEDVVITEAKQVCTITNTFNSATITIIKDARPNHPQNFGYVMNGNGLVEFVLDDDSDPLLSNTAFFSFLSPGTYTVTEGLVPGWKLDNVTCTTNAKKSLAVTTSPTRTIDLDPGEDVVCTFTNDLISEVAVCGDGVKNAGEACDGTDGVTLGQNFCTFSCSLVPIYTSGTICSEGKNPVLVDTKFVESFMTNGIVPDPVSVSLQSGKEYLIESTGTFGYGGVPLNNATNRADAAYVTDTNFVGPNLDTIFGSPATALYRGIHSLISDDGTGTFGVVNWGSYNPSHTYTKNYVPAVDTNVEFAISDWYDSWYSGDELSDFNGNQFGFRDNEGGLTLNIYECQPSEEEGLARLKIEKSNDSVSDEVPENEVTYTLRVTALDGPVNDVTVTDLPPAGFEYIAGSGEGAPFIHEYASPGIWDLGDMAKDEVKVLTYNTKISGSQDDGLYKDLAYAKGLSGATEIFANSDQTSQFVGTEVRVAQGPVAPIVVVDEEKEEETEKKKKKVVKYVLGATTLPLTGTPLGILALALSGLALGATLLVFGRRMRKASTLIASVAFAVTVFVGGASDVEAASISVALEAPESVMTTPSFQIGFVALDQKNRSLVVECFKDSDASPFATYVLESSFNGNSGNCQVDGSVLSGDGAYSFFVKLTAGGVETVTSDTVNVTLDAGTPGTPTNYDRDDNSCQATIKFVTASDGGETVKVELYRSTEGTFTANASTKVAEQAIGSATAGSFLQALPGCDDDVFYALRTVSSNGNGSAFVGDEDIDTTTKTETTTTTTTVVVPGSGGGALANADTTPEGTGTPEVQGVETTVPENETTSSNNESAVLGETTESEEMKEGGASAFFKENSILGTMMGLALLALLYFGYQYYKKRHEHVA